MVKLYHGKCESIMNDIPEKSIDLILCDLPYGISGCEWDKKISFDVLWQQYLRVKKINAPVVLFSNQPFTSELIISNLKHYRYNWYWIKNNSTGFCFAKYQPMRKVEDVCVFYENTSLFNQPFLKKAGVRRLRHDSESVYKSKTLANKYFQANTGYLNNMLFFESDDIGGITRFHPTQKPIKLLEFLIRVYTNIGGVVLDNTMGSGSTGVAAINTGRSFIGIEQEKKYFDIAEKRIKDAELLSAQSFFDIDVLESCLKAPPLAGNIQEDFFNDSN